jgi:hypothetical protein
VIDLGLVKDKNTVNIRFVLKKLGLEDSLSNRTLVGMQLYQDGWIRLSRKDGTGLHRWGNPKR